MEGTPVLDISSSQGLNDEDSVGASLAPKWESGMDSSVPCNPLKCGGVNTLEVSSQGLNAEESSGANVVVNGRSEMDRSMRGSPLISSGPLQGEVPKAVSNVDVASLAGNEEWGRDLGKASYEEKVSTSSSFPADGTPYVPSGGSVNSSKECSSDVLGRGVNDLDGKTPDGTLNVACSVSVNSSKVESSLDGVMVGGNRLDKEVPYDNLHLSSSVPRDLSFVDSDSSVPVIVSGSKMTHPVNIASKISDVGLSNGKTLTDNWASKEEEKRDTNLKVTEVVPKETTQVKEQSQVPLRQLARKGGILKTEAVADLKKGGSAPSIAEAVKEGILKKEKDQEQGEAVVAVMRVHGRKKEIVGLAAKFPGETAPESGRTCQCCNKPESSKTSIFCDNCERSFHLDCVKLWPRAARNLDVWHCVSCGLHGGGRYWPLGKVLVRYQDACAELQKHSMKYQQYMPKGKRSEVNEKGQEKPEGVREAVCKAKDIRDFKKEARKGSNAGYGAKYQTGGLVVAPGQLIGASTEYPAMHRDASNLPYMTLHYSATLQGAFGQQTKTQIYPGYVPIQPRPQLDSATLTVNSNVAPDGTVVRPLTSPTALRASQQFKANTQYTKYTVSPEATGLTYTGSFLKNAAPTKIKYMTTIDASNAKPLSSLPGAILGTSQTKKVPNMTESSATADPSSVHTSTLPSDAVQISAQPKATPPGGTNGQEVSSKEELRILLPGESLTERDELLKDAKESLLQLRTFITAIRGDLGEGWEAVLRRKHTGALDKYFLSPAKRKYRSRLQVARYLGLGDDTRYRKTKSGDFSVSFERAVPNRHMAKAPQGPILPIFCGDIMVEKLGTVDSRPTYSDDKQIWPIGFRSSWHDPETGSYCISEVGDGGDSGPVFRVTRKLVIGPVDSDKGPLAPVVPGKIGQVSGNLPVEAVESRFQGTGLNTNIGKTLTLIGSEVKSEHVGEPKLGAGGIDSIIENVDSQKQQDADEQPAQVQGVDRVVGNDQSEVNLVLTGSESVGKSIKDENGEVAKTQNSIDHTHVEEIKSPSSLEDTKPAAQVHSRDIMDARYSFLDVKVDQNSGKSTKSGDAELGLFKGHTIHHSTASAVIDLTDSEEERTPAPVLPRDILDPKYSFLDVKCGGTSSVEAYETHIRLDKEGGTDVIVHTKGVGLLPPHIKPLPNILMEELTVESRSSAEAWRLFGKQFVEHCRMSSGSGQHSVVPILEATDEFVKSQSTVPDDVKGVSSEKELAESDVLKHNAFGSREMTKALLYARLEKRLGEDRFGLNLPAVQKMIKDLLREKKSGFERVPFFDVEHVFKPEGSPAVPITAPNILKPTVDPGVRPWKTRKRKRKGALATDTAESEGDDFNKKKAKWQPPEPQASVHVLETLETTKQQDLERVVFYEDFVPAVIDLPAPAPPPIVFVEEPRLPPPMGQGIVKRLPPELVGDLLQVWEFLCRFSELLGQEAPLTLEDLEAGLVDMGPVTQGQDSGSKGKEDKVQYGSNLGSGDSTGKASTAGFHGEIGSNGGDKIVQELQNDDKPSDNITVAQDSRQDPLQTRNSDQSKSLDAMAGSRAGDLSFSGLSVEGGVDAVCKDPEGGKINEANETIAVQASGKMANAIEEVVFLEGTVSRGLLALGSAHIPLLKFLVSDLKFRIAGSQAEGEPEEPKKRGRKRVGDIGPLPPDFGDDLPMNVITWPELAHRYLLAFIEVKKQGEVADLHPDERKKLVRFFEGDGGVLGGAVEGVVGVESDAQVLAEAEKELTNRMPKPVEKDIVVFVPQEWDVVLTPINPIPKKPRVGKAGDRPEVLPKWVEALEPVRKMSTNLGTKIKIQVQESLDAKPPDWAKGTLEWSLSKGTFKSNAAGTTKRAVLEVLAQYHGEELKAINAPRVRKVKPAPSAEHLMQRCRIVLREVAKADSKQTFCSLNGGAMASKSNKVPLAVARPLDFRTIDARLAAGAYGGSTDAFAADMRQIWKNVEGAHKTGSAMVELANNLSLLFEKLYLKQVISLIKGVADTKEKEKAIFPDGDPKVDVVGKKMSTNAGNEKTADSKLTKAPWEDESTCRVCGIDEDYDSILLCDGCDAEYHIYCLVPPLEKVPEGNWFCPSCVAVEEGFPEAPCLGDSEIAALKEEEERPVAGSILRIEFEDEQCPAVTEEEKKNELNKGGKKLRFGSKRGLDTEDEPFSEEPEVGLPAVESAVQSLLGRMEEKEYWQLTLADKLFLLKLLCDEALKTPQVRAHLEKSVDVALELQQQLRDLVAERLKIVVPMDVSHSGKATDPENKQRVQYGAQTGQSMQGKDSKAREDAVVDSQEVAGVRISSCSEVGAAQPGDDKLGNVSEEKLEGVGKVVHDLDLNVVAVRELDCDLLPQDNKLVRVCLEFKAGSVQDSKKRSLGATGPPDGSGKEQDDAFLLGADGGNNKRLKVGSIPGEETTDVDGNKREESNNENKESPTLSTVATHISGSERGPSAPRGRGSGTGSGGVPLCNKDSLPADRLKRTFESGAVQNAAGDDVDNGKKAKREDKILIQSTQSGDGDVQETVVTERTLKDTPGETITDARKPDSLETEENGKGETTPLQSARDLDEKITSLGARLFNLSLRREHMGTDHLGREYWALSGTDQRPWLVVADMNAAKKSDEAGKLKFSLDSNVTLSTASFELRSVGDSMTSIPGRDSQDSSNVLRQSSLMGIFVALSQDGTYASSNKSLIFVEQHSVVNRISHGRENVAQLLKFSNSTSAVISSDRKQSNSSELKLANEGIQWLSYKGDKALDELVKWLSPRCQHERALRVAIYHWRRSVYPRHLLDANETILPNGPASKLDELSEDTGIFGDLKDSAALHKNLDRNVSHIFATIKATNLLQKRCLASSSLGSGDEDIQNHKRSLPQNDGQLRRCECLEPLWNFRLHCQICHESYENTAEFQIHQNGCSLGNTSTESREKEFLPQTLSTSKARKNSFDGSKGAVKIKRLQSIEKDQDLRSGKPWSATKIERLLEKEQELSQHLAKAGSGAKSERARRGLKRSVLQSTFGDELSTERETEEAPELLSKYFENVKTRKTPPPSVMTEPAEHTSTNGLLKALEELMEPSSQAYFPQPADRPNEESREDNGSFNLTFAQDDWGSNGWAEKYDVRRGKQVSNVPQLHNQQGFDANQLNDLNNLQGDQVNRGGWLSNQGFREDASSSFDNPSTPMFSIPDSTRDRINQIGLIADQGPTFAPALQVSPAFDPSLIIPSSPYYPCMDGFPSLENSNPPASQYQQFLPPHENLRPSPSHQTNLLLSLDNANSTPTQCSQFLSSLDESNSAGLNYQQFLPSHNTLNNTRSPYTNFLPNLDNLNLTPSSYTNFLPSLNKTNSTSALYPQYLPSFDNSNPNVNSNLTPAHYAHFPPNNTFMEPELRRFDLGRFNSNSWFDAQSSGDSMPVERPSVIPTKPTARRTSTWDYLTNIPLPPSQVSDKFVQKHHVEGPRGHPVAPAPIEVGSLPFDLMFEKPQREDLNIRTDPDEVGTLTLDLMFEKPQNESPSIYSLRQASPMAGASLNLDLTFERQECEGPIMGRMTEATSVEGGSLSIDLMSVPEDKSDIVPEEQIDPIQEDPMEIMQEARVDSIRETQVESPQEEQLATVTEAPPELKAGTTEPHPEQNVVVPVPVGGGKKPVKRFPVVDASVRPLVGEQKFFLKGLQISLLDMEAAMTNDALEPSRASSVRRRAWRLFVKSAVCIYEVTKATILLEHMVKADCLKSSWGYWSSLSAAARSASVSSLALRLFALDGAITYEREKALTDGTELTYTNKNVKKKKKKPLEMPQKRKK